MTTVRLLPARNSVTSSSSVAQSRETAQKSYTLPSPDGVMQYVISVWKPPGSLPSASGSTPTGAIRLCSRYRHGAWYSMSCQRVIRPLMPVDLA